MSAGDDMARIARDRARADQVLKEVCSEFDASLEAAASGAVGKRYAAVPSWYVAGTAPVRPCRPYAGVPSWCIDAPTARRLLSDIRTNSRSDQ